MPRLPFPSARLPLVAMLLLGPLLFASARADVPAVVTDIPPVHSLVAQVMGELGEPVPLVRPGASPHGHALRPSEAAALEASELIVWTGEALTPWLARDRLRIAPDALSLELMTVEGTRHRALREESVFADEREADVADDSHAHGDSHEATEDDGHSAEADGHAHGHTGDDPHGWLDPLNAHLWLGAIADALSRLDPSNAAAYAANAAAARGEIDALVTRVTARLTPVQGEPFVVFHDGFHHFEDRFGVPALGALLAGEAVAPGPARVQSLRKAVIANDVRCAFTEPQLDTRVARALVDGLELRQATLDPLGAAIEPGPALYGEVIEGMASAIADCLAS